MSAKPADPGAKDGVSAEPAVAPIPRTALSRKEAALSLGVSLDFFEDHIQPHVPMLRLGRKRLVPITALVRWLDDNAASTIR
jgi:hypothetical protein